MASESLRNIEKPYRLLLSNFKDDGCAFRMIN